MLLLLLLSNGNLLVVSHSGDSGTLLTVPIPAPFTQVDSTVSGRRRIIRSVQPQTNFTSGELPLAAALAAVHSASERRGLSVPHSHSESCLRIEERAFRTRQLSTAADSHACSAAT